ncbi:toll/interleukin-1 receptor domain-containing adapter protein isoform X1 [Heterocephalus glaber]|uniref:Toll/interleukin-1 receptor domain-containing adapter protein n=2 Tax=Heterocephalus glaber TaxID=10181 RepID=A0AAX6RNP4_HETGA|nr:toll/interleukin-1 receptor domain-containing adapter protein isoform X1 [Heterocephalus glaber]XP_021098431.1 toll/interleukin-1 receptor domain-containing adapter protein isoform X1 [Heterocephalus glaber]XP_021098432.1 toll/interleukin-1 receptor domain-containing adapter protein isoform X1 [Heterocephalus glaber]XP_021098433.1 toll/interleukin-1 receptor domain-containing adapter protein isoform X1 [Heterocephalus glaber]
MDPEFHMCWQALYHGTAAPALDFFLSNEKGWLLWKVNTGPPPSAWTGRVSFEPDTMASSPSLPVPHSQPRKPLGRMADWFRQALLKKPRNVPISSESHLSGDTQLASQDSAPPLSLRSVASSTPPPIHSDTSSSGRWSKDYDACVCHSEEDLTAAQELVSYLEGSSNQLRCFLQLRDATPGGAIVSELCQALSSSHCHVLLITPGFLCDPWCKFQMLQALTQAPGAEGCTIPLMSGLTRDAYPAELRFMYYVDGSGPDRGFRQVKEAVMRYLQTLS